MSLLDELRFQVSFALSLIPIVLDIIQFLGFALLHRIMGTDPDAPSTFPSSPSLPSPKMSASSCPYSRLREKHPYIPPGPNDARAPCPALNTMANHGFLPRDGRKLTGTNLTHALMECYNLSWPLAAFLAWGGVLLLGQSGTFSLHDLSRHNRIEHDASLTHPNTPEGKEYAPIDSDPKLFNQFLNDARDGAFRATDIARARVRREAEPGMQVTAVQQEIARGEVALVLQIFGGDKFAVPVDIVKEWWGTEKLPDGWEPTRKTTLVGTVYWSSVIRHAMEALRERGVGESLRGVNGEASRADLNGYDVEQMTRARNANTPPTANGALEPSESESDSYPKTQIRQRSIPVPAAA